MVETLYYSNNFFLIIFLDTYNHYIQYIYRYLRHYITLLLTLLNNLGFG